MAASFGSSTCGGSGSPLCNTGLYANDVLCEVINNLDCLIENAGRAKEDAEAAVLALKESTDEDIDNIANLEYDPDTSGVDTDFVAPTAPTAPDYESNKPTKPTLPSPTVPFISQTTIDDRFADAASKISRVGTKRERDAAYRASSMGIGMANAALTIGLRAAEEESNKGQQEVGLQENIKYADWLREDAKFAHDLAQTGYSNEIESEQARRQAETARFTTLVANYTAKIRSEGERRGWSELEINRILTEADKATQFALDKLTTLSELTFKTNEVVGQLTNALATAIYTAASFNLSGRGSQEVSEVI